MQRDIISQELDPQFLHGDELDLVQQLLHKNPLERLGASYGIKEIKDHSYFDDFEWKEIIHQKHKYQKQYLKIDLTQTNFDYNELDKYNIGIDIDEEIEGDDERLDSLMENEDFG